MKTPVRFLIIPAMCQALLCTSAMAAKGDDDPSAKKKGSQEQKQEPKKQESKPAPRSAPAPEKKAEKQQAPKTERQKQDPKPAPRKAEMPAEKKVVQKQPEPRVDKQPEKKTSKPEVTRSDRQVAPKPQETGRNPAGEKKKDQTADRNPGPKDSPTADNNKSKKQVVPEPPKNAKGDKDLQVDPDRVAKIPKDGRGVDERRDKSDRTTQLPQDRRTLDDRTVMPLPGKRPDANRGDRRDLADIDSDRKGKPDKKANKALDLPGRRPVAAASREIDRDQVYQADRERLARNRQYAAQRNDGPRAKPIVRPGQNIRQVRRPDFERVNNTNTWWDSGRRTASRDVRIVNNTTVINNNFTRNVNWSTRRTDWGYNPWWNRPQVRPWYGSSWSYGWSSDYYHNHYYYDRWDHGYRPPGYVSTRTAIGWGLIGWSLGALVYNTGYQSYYNPYQTRPVTLYGGREFSYSQPITRIAVSTVPTDDHAVEEITRKSETFMTDSQAAFRRQDYLVALELADRAVAESPGDGALHEYRALVLFALGRYGEAAGVLNPVLASGPGWTWSTMIALYDSQQIYTDQLQRLETYTEQKPDAADMHFLLGYHYMVCGHLDLATPQFDMATKLMPKDNVSRQLADLTRSSSTDTDAKTQEVEKPGTDVAPPPPVPLEKLTGTWVSNREGAGAVTLVFKGDGKFSWSYDDNGKTTEFSGDYSMNDDGLLVLDSDQTQMVASVDLPQDREMKFVLAGGQPGDPGLDFKKS